MEPIRSFRDLRTWRESHALTIEIYALTKRFPDDERYGLTSQMRRAATSVPSNIAEGMGRSTGADFIRFLIVARGSTQEIIYQLILSDALGYGEKQAINQLIIRYNGLAAGINKHIAQLQKVY